MQDNGATTQSKEDPWDVKEYWAVKPSGGWRMISDPSDLEEDETLWTTRPPDPPGSPL